MQGTRINRRIILTNILFASIATFLILFDQITKTVCQYSYLNGWVSTPVINGFFSFTYTRNTGAAFSFLANTGWGQIFFMIITPMALVLFFVYYVYACKKNYRWLRVAVIFVLSGTIGNFIDRLAYGYVVDFLSFTFGTWNFPIFNLADVFMCVGMFMVIFHYLFLDKNAVFKKKDDKNISSN